MKNCMEAIYFILLIQYDDDLWRTATAEEGREGGFISKSSVSSLARNLELDFCCVLNILTLKYYLKSIYLKFQTDPIFLIRQDNQLFYKA